MKTLILVILSIFLMMGQALAQEPAGPTKTTIAWTHGGGSNLDGFELYWSDTKPDVNNVNFSNKADVSKDKRQHTILGLEKGKTYWFAARAYDLPAGAGANRRYSDYSDILEATLSSEKPVIIKVPGKPKQITIQFEE